MSLFLQSRSCLSQLTVPGFSWFFFLFSCFFSLIRPRFERSITRGARHASTIWQLATTTTTAIVARNSAAYGESLHLSSSAGSAETTGAKEAMTSFHCFFNAGCRRRSLFAPGLTRWQMSRCVDRSGVEDRLGGGFEPQSESSQESADFSHRPSVRTIYSPSWVKSHCRCEDGLSWWAVRKVFIGPTTGSAWSASR